jgi:hypothetical protein
MIKSRNDYKCTLVGRDGSTLKKFNASTVGDFMETVSFVGGGIASAGQALTIWTETAFEYKPYEHSVIIGGNTFKLVSVTRGMRKKMGASCLSKIVPVYVLALE